MGTWLVSPSQNIECTPFLMAMNGGASAFWHEIRNGLEQGLESNLERVNGLHNFFFRDSLVNFLYYVRTVCCPSSCQ